MSTDRLAFKDDHPLANSTTIDEVRPATADDNREEVVTVFDVANEIEMTLKQLEAKTVANDKQFEQTLKLFEEKLSRMNR